MTTITAANQAAIKIAAEETTRALWRLKTLATAP